MPGHRPGSPRGSDWRVHVLLPVMILILLLGASDSPAGTGRSQSTCVAACSGVEAPCGNECLEALAECIDGCGEYSEPLKTECETACSAVRTGCDARCSVMTVECLLACTRNPAISRWEPLP